MSKKMSHERLVKLVTLAIFTAIVVIVQTFSCFIRLGGFPFSAGLIPIVVGAALFGTKAGAYLGMVFGIVVSIACGNGTDPTGHVLFTASPMLTVCVSMVKGIAAGTAAGCIYRALVRKNPYAAVAVAAVAASVLNAGLYCLALHFLFPETLAIWAGGSQLLLFLLTTMVGVGFVVELVLNTAICPLILKIIRSLKQSV